VVAAPPVLNAVVNAAVAASRARKPV